ncbi:hypothetical protein ACFLWS_00605 [Chloroflexota bacterium]
MKKEKKDKLPEQGSESPFQRFEQMTKKIVSAPQKVKPSKTEGEQNQEANW